MSAEPSRYADTADEFDFQAGDTVLVRVREHGGSNGPLAAKFLAECEGFADRLVGGSPKAVLAVEWGGVMGDSFRFNYYDAEFEVVEDRAEVRF